MKLTINFLKKYGIYIVTLLLLLILLSKCNQTKNIQAELIKEKQNIEALKDTIKTEKKKNGEIESSISGFIATQKELKDLNNILYQKVKEEHGQVISLSNAIVNLKQDTAILRKSLNLALSKIHDIKQINDSTWLIPWTLVYNYDKDSINKDEFVGQTVVGVVSKDPLKLKHNGTELISRSSTIDFTFGEKFEDGKLRIFLSSKYPGFKPEQLRGVLLDPKDNKELQKLMGKKHWFQGFSIGIGTTAGFNVTNGGYGLTIGPSVMWNIYTW